VRVDLERLDVDVGLVEAVEDDEPTRPRVLELLCERREGRVERRELHRDGDRHARAHRREDVERALLDERAWLSRVGGHVIDVELERVRAGLLDLLRVLEPARGRDAVERRDDGHRDGLADAADLLEVRVGPEAVLARLGEERARLGERVRVRLEVVEEALVRGRDLLLEDRVHHDRGGARVLEALDHVEVIHERRGARHEGMCEREAEVVGAEVHRRRLRQGFVEVLAEGVLAEGVLAGVEAGAGSLEPGSVIERARLS
jgi:hypothetical protein